MAKQYLLAFIFLVVLVGYVDSQGHPCERQCVLGAEPMVCEYNFTIEWYLTLSKACYDCPFNLSDCYRPHCVSGDGQRRKVITVNRQYPGPKIEVCENDTVIVHVVNELSNGEGTIIHWHGMVMRGNNHMDGAGRVTQCPIPQFNEFTYEFLAYPSGTFVWHAHYGKQRADGLSGPLIVQEPKQLNPHYYLYDHDCDTPNGDCEMMNYLSEWMKPDYNFLDLRIHHYTVRTPEGRNDALVNGRMQYYNATNELHPGQTALTPYEVFNVEQGKAYRVRLIGFSVECGYELSVDGHTLLVNAADGYYVDPVQVDVLALMPGERYDYIFRADQAVDNYWMKFVSPLCGPGYAIIRYAGAPEADPEADKTLTRDGVVLNPIYPIIPNPARTLIYAGELNHTRNEDYTDEVVDEVHYISMDFLLNDREVYHHPVYYPVDEIDPIFASPLPVFNNISNKDPKSPFVTQYDDIDPATLCNGSTIDHEACYDTRCYCTNLEKATLGNVVDLVFINLGSPSFGHPIHLHGYHFRVMAQIALGRETFVDDVKRMYENGEIPIKAQSPTYRDTIIVPAAGVVIARIKADNPGFWLMHCHVDVHADVGQMMVLQVGERDQMAPAPTDMPKCGDWAPSSGINHKGRENAKNEEKSRTIKTRGERKEYEEMKKLFKAYDSV